MGDDDRAQINIRLSHDAKDKWVTRAEQDAEYSSLSHMIRLSVERELQHQDENSAAHVEAEFPELSADIEQIRLELEQIQATTRTILEEQQAANIEDLAGDLYDIIPVVYNESIYHEYIESGDWPENEPMISWGQKKTLEFDGDTDIREARPSRIEDFAKVLGESELRVKQAAERLEQSFQRVKIHDTTKATYVYEISDHEFPEYEEYETEE